MYKLVRRWSTGARVSAFTPIFSHTGRDPAGVVYRPWQWTEGRYGPLMSFEVLDQLVRFLEDAVTYTSSSPNAHAGLPLLEVWRCRTENPRACGLILNRTQSESIQIFWNMTDQARQIAAELTPDEATQGNFPFHTHQITAPPRGTIISDRLMVTEQVGAVRYEVERKGLDAWIYTPFFTQT